jgi:hypothetical protein
VLRVFETSGTCAGQIWQPHEQEKINRCAVWSQLGAQTCRDDMVWMQQEHAPHSAEAATVACLPRLGAEPEIS